MADQDHLEILNQGVEAWNKWRDDNPEIKPDLGGADLYGANLCGADLRRAYLGGANLCDIRMGWMSHRLISEILYRAAGNDVDRQRYAAWIARRIDLCWEDFLGREDAELPWALDELRTWIKPDDGCPDVLKG